MSKANRKLAVTFSKKLPTEMLKELPNEFFAKYKINRKDLRKNPFYK